MSNGGGGGGGECIRVMLFLLKTRCGSEGMSVLFLYDSDTGSRHFPRRSSKMRSTGIEEATSENKRHGCFKC